MIVSSYTPLGTCLTLKSLLSRNLKICFGRPHPGGICMTYLFFLRSSVARAIASRTISLVSWGIHLSPH